MFSGIRRILPVGVSLPMLLGCLLASSLLAGRSVCAQVGFGHSYSASAGTTPAAKTVTRAQSPERPSPFYPDAGQVFTPGVSPWVTTPTGLAGRAADGAGNLRWRRHDG